MQVTVIVDDNTILVNGFAESCDLSGMPDYIHALQWYGAYGEIEFRAADDGSRQANKRVEDFEEFKKYIAAWETKAKEEIEIAA